MTDATSSGWKQDW